MKNKVVSVYPNHRLLITRKLLKKKAREETKELLRNKNLLGLDVESSNSKQVERKLAAELLELARGSSDLRVTRWAFKLKGLLDN